MILKDISFLTPAENILYDEVLLKCADSNPKREVLRLWESPENFIVLGRIGDVAVEVNREVVEKKSIQILRRASGGGTVLQGPGCLNYSLILSKQRPGLNDLKESYSIILEKVVSALAVLNVEAQVFPISDIALSINHKKISGNAQKRGRYSLLHHGTILVDYDLSLIEKYLSFPPSIPQYRENRDHCDFISNIKRSSFDLKQALIKEFDASVSEPVLSDEQQLLDELLQSKDVIISI